MVKINPGSNVHGDNKTGTMNKGMENVIIPEPKTIKDNKLQCPVCDQTFDSREEYLSHVMARHQSETIEPERTTTRPTKSTKSSRSPRSARSPRVTKPSRSTKSTRRK
ncbi:MAG TPA: hypothetical protein VK209_11250 [Candidatus Sulfotelmatobacter sp.]|nr:hypothetical protein [Candidatus Sulfotelmatobacter sp.]